MRSSESGANFEPEPFVSSLQDMGFSLEEAERLAFMRAHFQDQTEYQERLALQRRFQFAQWLVHTGRLKR